MLPKNTSRRRPFEATKQDLKPFLKIGRKIFIIGVALEFTCLAASYFGFRKLNESIEAREYLSKNFPVILDGYYYVTDNVAGRTIRESDRATWSQSEKSWKENVN